MTWEEAGGRCWVLQGSYSCVCLDNYKGAHCTDKQGQDTSRLTIIILIVVLVMAVILVAFIVVFLCARYKAGSTPQDDQPVAFKSSGVAESELALKDIYSTLSRGKPVAFNERSFSVGDASSVEAVSMGKG